MKNGIAGLLLLTYYIGTPITFIYLTFFNGYAYTWWNWIIVVPLNLTLSVFWPGYWLVVRPLFG